ncbi:MAG: LamG domain-containing protein [Chloroflexota bacterium]|nr:LamG domain-containing protein [Chloroflexota bacterium]
MDTLTTDRERLVGYAEPWSVAPGETVRFMVRSTEARYRASVVQLFHGDARAHAPGLKERAVATPIDGDYDGKAQTYPIGSHVIVPHAAALDVVGGFTLAAWIFPTLLDGRAQGLLTKSSPSGQGYGLILDATGALALRLGGQDISTRVPLRAGQWYFVAGTYDPARGTARVEHRLDPAWPMPHGHAVATSAAPKTIASSGGPFVMAGWWVGAGQHADVDGHFDGKIEAPVLFGAPLDDAALTRVAEGAPAATVAPAVADWDFGSDIPSDLVRDVAGHGLDGRTVNMPARGMSGHAFGGGERSWALAPETHRVIHFHHDDLEDCRWDVAFELTVPDAFSSGIYAAKLAAGDIVDHVPFFVRPKGRRAVAPVLFLVPTNSYLAYANFREDFSSRNGVLGLYHMHADGSAVFYSSRRRPIVNLRPGSTFDILEVGRTGAPHQFNADLYLVDWLTEKGIAFDIATDEDLDREGDALLGQYRVVLTGSHPEYWSAAMLDGLRSYLNAGGRFMYLGGNGLIWTTSFDRVDRHLVEVRRGGASQRSATPGESHHSTTGEFGGYWRGRGRAPNRLVGVGSIAQGFDRSSPYARQPGASDPRAAWIFDGVPEGPIGDFGLTMGGAAGFEVDAADDSLGTPPHTLIIASALEFSPTYEHQNPVHVPGTEIDQHPPMRSDMVFFETPSGGAVFSVGSIAYCGALSHNGYDNSISRLTENVLRRFASPDPIPAPS